MSHPCPRQEEILGRLLAEDSPAAPAEEELRRHLAECPGCTAAWQRVQSFERTMGAAVTEVGDHLRPDLAGPWNSPGPAPRTDPWNSAPAEPRPPWLPILVGALLLAVVALGLLWTLPRPGTDALPGPASPGKPAGPVASGGPAVPGFQVVEGAVTRAGEPGNPLPPAALPLDVRLEATEGTTIRFPSGVEARLGKATLLPGGTQVRSGGTTFSLNDAALTLMVGFVRVQVPKRKTRFSVATPYAVMGVRGTRFTVEVLPTERTKVEVQEGSVSVTSITGVEQLLSPGEGLEIEIGGKLVPVLAAPAGTPISPLLPGGSGMEPASGAGGAASPSPLLQPLVQDGSPDPATPPKELTEPVKNADDALGD